METEGTRALRKPTRNGRGPAAGSEGNGAGTRAGRVLAARRWSTKAETLAALSGRLRHATIPSLVYFSVHDWQRQRARVLKAIASRLRGDRLAVRSSACDEDGRGASCAGHYRTCLNVANRPAELTVAIESVVASFHGSPEDQVLVQEMVSDVAASGVIATRDPQTGGPYYVIEYDDESARTDRVTAGVGIHKTLVVHHAAGREDVPWPRLHRLLAVTRELDQRWRGTPIELEFAEEGNGAVSVLQVRPLPMVGSLARTSGDRATGALERLAEVVADRDRPRPNLAGSRTILGQMPDWNPAELIGSNPAPLAASLFCWLITDETWQQARAAMGYRPVPREPLVVLLAERPYVDVRVSFNSFLPDGLPVRVQNLLVDAWLQRLHERPELHDKVEFEVAQTAMDFSFASAHRARYGRVLPSRDRVAYVEALRHLTSRAVDATRTGSLARALATVERLAPAPPAVADEDERRLLCRGLRVLDACRRHGALGFATVARHAFVAEALLRSVVERGAWTPQRMRCFRRSLTTVAGLLAHDLAAVLSGTMSRRLFLAQYGHVRPGAFDITSLRYDQRPEIFADGRSALDRPGEARRKFVPEQRELVSLDRLIRECGFSLCPEEILRYAACAIVGRERAKFLFARHLSDALECIATWGVRRGLTRDELAFLTLEDLRTEARAGASSEIERLRALVAARSARGDDLRALRLSPLIRSVADLYVLPPQSVMPTFVTARAVAGRPVLLDGRMRQVPRIADRLVCIESADPGFDWIFAHRIAGLITRFGGGNSHMAIRCCELAVPAAIGVGEALFERLAGASRVELRCREKIVRSVWPDVSV